MREIERVGGTRRGEYRRGKRDGETKDMNSLM